MTYPYALTFDRYRELMDRDFNRLLDVAEPAMDQSVPGCGGWTGRNLIRHTALVYLQKAETIRTGSKPVEGWPPEELKLMHPVRALTECYSRLMEQFDSHHPEDPAETWVQDDQTVGFWIRRLALETAIHRHDTEAAADLVTPLDTDLAVDGIDEILTVMLCRSKPDESASGSALTLKSAGRAWTLLIKPSLVELERQVNDLATATVNGPPEQMLLWLWGRAPLPAGSSDSAAARELRSRLITGT